MKFEKGDIVICIDNKDAFNLKLYGKYTFYGYFENGKYPIHLGVFVINGEYLTLNLKRFILLEEFRTFKINKIKERCKKHSLVG